MVRENQGARLAPGDHLAQPLMPELPQVRFRDELSAPPIAATAVKNETAASRRPLGRLQSPIAGFRPFRASTMVHAGHFNLPAEPGRHPRKALNKNY